MIKADIAIPLGTNLEDDSEVSLSPTGGPLLIFGDSGSGTSFTLKTIFSRLAKLSESSDGVAPPPLLFDPTASSGYGRVARTLGAKSLTVGIGGQKQIISADSTDLARGPITPLVFSADFELPRRSHSFYLSSEALDELLMDHVYGGAPVRHVLADNLKALLTHQMAFGLLWWAFKNGAAANVLGAAVIEDPDALISNSEGKKLLSVTRRILLMRTARPEGLPNPVRRAMKASGVDSELLADLGQGQGVLLHKPKRGDALEPALMVHVEATDKEHRVFNTDPKEERRLRQ